MRRHISVSSIFGLYLMAQPCIALGAMSQDAPFEAPNVEQFLAACDRDLSQCDFEVRMALLDKLHSKNAKSVCLKGGHYQEPVINWLKDHPETLSMNTEDGIYTAITTLYPCP